MSKRNIDWNDSKLKQRLSEGRGTGEKEDYTPWHKTQDFPSYGRASRLLGVKTGRIHHFFSKTQRDYFLLLDWDDSVYDIREQFPLLDYKTVISELSDIECSKFSNDIADYVLTTTFLGTMVNDDGSFKYFARSVKYASDLEKKIAQEKLEIERRYWESKSIEWKLVTNKDINMVKVKNLEYINQSSSLKYTNESFEDISHRIRDKYLWGNDKILSTIFADIDNTMGLPRGECILIFKSLLARKMIIVDINEMIDIRRPMELVFRY